MDRDRRRRPRARSMAKRKRSLKPLLWTLVLLFVISAGAALIYRSVTVKGSSEGVVQEPYPLSAISDSRVFSDSLNVYLDRVLGGLGIEGDLINKYPRSDRGPKRTRVRVPKDLSLLVCNLEVSRLVKDLGGEVLEARQNEKGTKVSIRAGMDGVETDLILLSRDDRIVRKKGKIAIVLDDFGYQRMELAREFCRLPQSLTLAVFPDTDNSQKIAQMALDGGHEVMIHLPMEPKGFPLQKPGEGAVYTIYSTREIKRITKKAIRAMPKALGLSNHMGSRATEDMRVMRAVLSEIKRNKLYFVDSRTSSNSIAYDLAEKMGIQCAKASLFIDNPDDVMTIEERLMQAADLAAGEGTVIAVGHDKAETLHALRAVLPKLEKRGFKFVKVSDIVN